MVLSSQVRRQIFFCLQHIICCLIQRHIMLSHRSSQFHSSVWNWLYISVRWCKTTNYSHSYIACQNIDIMPWGWSSKSHRANLMRIKLPCPMQNPKILPLGQALQERNHIPRVTILCILMRRRLQSVNNTNGNGGHTSYWLFVNIFWPWTLK